MIRNSPKWLESLTTRHLVSTITVSLCLPVLVLFGILQTGAVSLEDAAKFVDASVKITVVLVGGLWAVNRYFVQRTDAPQLRVDVDLNVIRFDTSDKALMLYRLDIVNTGNGQIPEFEQFVEIESIHVKDSKLKVENLHRWPENDSHPGGPIEPGSWSAVNEQLLCPANIAAARMLIEIRMPFQRVWTWHKTFDVTGD